MHALEPEDLGREGAAVVATREHDHVMALVRQRRRKMPADEARAVIGDVQRVRADGGACLELGEEEALRPGQRLVSRKEMLQNLQS